MQHPNPFVVPVLSLLDCGLPWTAGKLSLQPCNRTRKKPRTVAQFLRSSPHSVSQLGDYSNDLLVLHRIAAKQLARKIFRQYRGGGTLNACDG